MTDRALSSRETQAIVYVMQGYMLAAAAEKMGCKERTVRFHLDNAKCKMKAKTLAHLVAKFMTEEMQKREAV